MAKRIDPLKAKQAQQKKIAIGLGVVLVAVGAFQGPKTLKMLKGPQPVTSAAPSTPAGTPPATPPTATTPGATPPSGGLPAPAAVQQNAVLADSDLPPAASTSQLLSFEQFQTKDPFAQQVDVAETSDDAAPSGTEAAPAAGDSSTGPEVGAGTGSSPQDQDANAPPASFSTPGSGDDPAAEAPEPAAATKISINGVVATVATKATFPAEEPVFQLVSLARDGKSVQIGVAGGSYATGEPTIKLLLGKTLTLQNTADGSRYELKLLTVEGFVTRKRKK
jgi:hypothetical protein